MSIPFHVYPVSDDGVLHHRCSGWSLGTSGVDVGFIVDGMEFEIRPGDVVELDSNFLMIDDIRPSGHYRDPSSVEYHYLPMLEDLTHIFADGPWSPAMVTRLRQEALGGRE